MTIRYEIEFADYIDSSQALAKRTTHKNKRLRWMSLAIIGGMFVACYFVGIISRQMNPAIDYGALFFGTCGTLLLALGISIFTLIVMQSKRFSRKDFMVLLFFLILGAGSIGVACSQPTLPLREVYSCIPRGLFAICLCGRHRRPYAKSSSKGMEEFGSAWPAVYC